MTIGGISVTCYIKSSRFSPKNSSAFPASSLSCNTKERVIILKILKKSVIKIYKKTVMPSISYLIHELLGGLYIISVICFLNLKKNIHIHKLKHIYLLNLF